MFKTSLTRDVVGKLIIRNTFCYADPEIDEFFTLHNFPVLKVSMAWWIAQHSGVIANS